MNERLCIDRGRLTASALGVLVCFGYWLSDKRTTTILKRCGQLIERAEPAKAVPRFRRVLGLAALGFFVAIGASMYFGGAKSTKSATVSAPSVADVAESSSTPSSLLVPFASRAEGGIVRLEKFLPVDRVTDAQFGVPYLLTEDVTRLHARQQADLERMKADHDAVIIGADHGKGAAVTLRELRALHEQQGRTLATPSDADVVIPAREDGSSALTVADLRALHEQQEKTLKVTASPDEIAIAGSARGGVDLTVGEITALHERQRAELARNTGPIHDYPAPLGNGRGYALTVEQLRDLHKGQSLK